MTDAVQYSLPDPMPWRAIATPLGRAEDALARLDERLSRSPVREGWIARTHLTEAAPRSGSRASSSISKTSCCMMSEWMFASRPTP
jgi:hypothetical protein